MGAWLIILCLVTIQCVIPGECGRKQSNINCRYEFHFQPPQSAKGIIDEMSRSYRTKDRAMSGSYYDYDLNFREQIFPSSFGDATVHDNVRLDAQDEKKQENNQPRVLFQEGRSFCISGEHFNNSKTFTNYPEFKGFQPLAKVGFNIGAHISPLDYAQMNVYPWKIFDNKAPQYDFFKSAVPDFNSMYKWEPTDPVFFHTRLSRPDRDPTIGKHPDPNIVINEPDRRIPLPEDGGHFGRPADLDLQPHPGCLNPYFIEVTEIEVDGVRLHNWLHITVFVRRSILKLNHGLPNCATGKMRWLMLEVRDGLGLPIGDFNTEVPCGTSCTCKTPKVFINGVDEDCKKVTGTRRHSMNCMHTPMRAVTQPGMLLYSTNTNGNGTDYFTEMHTSWHFAQHTSYFASELHFVALVVEEDITSTYYTSRQTKYSKPASCQPILTSVMVTDSQGCPPGSTLVNATIPRPGHKCCAIGQSTRWTWDEFEFNTDKNFVSTFREQVCNPTLELKFYSPFYQEFKNNSGYYSFSLQHMSDKQRPYGWTPQYKALRPTIETLGAWDAFNLKGVQLNRINCHKKINFQFYEELAYKDSLIPKRKGLFKWNSSYEVFSWDNPRFGRDLIHDKSTAVERAKSDTADFFSVYSLENLFYETEIPSDEKTAKVAKVSRFYFGTANTKEAYDGYKLPPEIQSQFNKFKPMENISFEERCACPMSGATENPENATLPTQILQGRSTHATQMLLAWVVLIPIAIFVIRYYKETYMRVFLLHEFWWYSTHFLCLLTALVFMIGGILAIEYKRMEPPKWTDELLAHVLMGSIACSLFVFHLLLGSLRFNSLTLRAIQITLHFAFGVLEYFLAVASIISATLIPQGRMPCHAFITYVVFLVIQILFYIFMECHFRHVDNLMHLYPPRRYCPVPTVRVFHRNPPLSKLRIVILGFYAVICWLFYVILRIEIQQGVASCFKDLGNDYDDDVYENF